MSYITRQILLIAAFVPLAAVNLLAQTPVQGDTPPHSGPYFGMTPPGTTPTLFAPGMASTDGYDITPTFSPDLNEVFLGRRPTEEGSDNRIYYSSQRDGVWQEPTLATFASGAMEFEAQFSCDGQRVYYNCQRELWFSDKTADGWSRGKRLDPPVAEGMCVAIAQRGNLYFTAARRLQGYGIFRSEYRDEQYLEPELVIPLAAHPFVAPDESYLLMDKYDDNRKSKLYVSFRSDDGVWSEPKELGQDVNATGSELIAKVSPDGKYLFFQRKVDNNTDIYWVGAELINLLRTQATE